ncbi:MAG: ROK family protein [Prevotella sp.]
MQTSISIDLGGTNIRVAKVCNNTIVRIKKEACKAQGTEQEVIQQIQKMIDELIDSNVQTIGFGIPSIVDTEKGIAYNLVNIPSWKEVHLRTLFENLYHVPVKVDNDVNCFVLAEQRFGSLKDFKDVVGITLGTGVGAGIIINNQLYRGLKTGAGEIGCLPYLDDCYETYCSSGFFSKHKITGEKLFQDAINSDATAKQLWNEFGYHLGKLLQVVFYTYAPQAIVIGGGLSQASEFFHYAMIESLHKGFLYPSELNEATICYSKLPNSNLLGASCLP